jgi:hypothetical protein
MIRAGVASICVASLPKNRSWSAASLLFALLLGELVALQRKQHAPAGDHEGKMRVHVGRVDERQRAIARRP